MVDPGLSVTAESVSRQPLPIYAELFPIRLRGHRKTWCLAGDLARP